MGFLSSVVGGALGFAVAGPIGAVIGGAISYGLGENKSNGQTCPHCNKGISLNEYGDYDCPHCENLILFNESGILKHSNFKVICPYCEKEVVISENGDWNCCHCNKVFTYNNTDNSSETSNPDEDDPHPSLFYLFAMFAKLAKANGVITNKHISVVDAIIKESFEYEGNDRKIVINYFREAKDTDIAFDNYCLEFYNSINISQLENPNDFFIEIIHMLFQIATAEANISAEQNRMLNIAGSIFRIDSSIIESIKESYINNDENTLQKYLKILNCTETDSFETIKSNYRKLVMQYHPDKYANKDLPEFLIAHSKEKFQETQEAYEYLNKYYNK